MSRSSLFPHSRTKTLAVSMRGKNSEQDLTSPQLCWQQQWPSPLWTGWDCSARGTHLNLQFFLSSPHGLLSDESCIAGSGLHARISLNSFRFLFPAFEMPFAWDELGSSAPVPAVGMSGDGCSIRFPPPSPPQPCFVCFVLGSECPCFLLKHPSRVAGCVLANAKANSHWAPDNLLCSAEVCFHSSASLWGKKWSYYFLGIN